MSEEEKQPLVSLGFRDRTNIVRIIPRDKDAGIAGWLRQIANICEKNEVESAIVVMVSRNKDCDFMLEVLNKQHAALLALQLDDVRSDLKDLALGQDAEGEDLPG